VLDEVLGFVTSALQTHEQDQGIIADLNHKVAQHDKIVLEKVAALQKSALDTRRIPAMISSLVELKICTPQEGAKIASRIQEDPNSVFDLCIKMADAIVQPGEGQEFLDSTDRRSEDQDGWFKSR